MKDQTQRQKKSGNSGKTKLGFRKHKTRDGNFYGPAVQREVSPQEQNWGRLSNHHCSSQLHPDCCSDAT